MESTEVWHCERPGEAISEGAASVAIDGPELKGVMHRSWGLAPWREPRRGYWWSLVIAEDRVTFELPVPCDDQDHQQQWSTDSWSLEDKMCATKGRAGEVTQALGGARKIVLNHWSLSFAFDCDCALIFSLLKEASILVEPTVKRLWIFKRLWILIDIGNFKGIELRSFRKSSQCSEPSHQPLNLFTIKS